MNSSQTKEAGPVAAKVSPPWRSAFRLLLQAIMLLMFVNVVLVAIVVLVPDGNDYALATIDKHARLEKIESPKIVLVGGSNLAYGIDSQTISATTNYDVVNMGMNGWLGVRFMLAEIAPALRDGDIVVLSFEYDGYYANVDGVGRDLLMITKNRPAAMTALTADQFTSAYSMIPYAAQQKALRLVKEGLRSLKPAPVDIDRELTGWDIVESVETNSGFNRFGDLESHLGIEWTFEREEGFDLTALGIDPDVVGIVQAFSNEMDQRGVTVVVSYCPVMRAYYDQHRETINDLHHRLQSAGLRLPLSPEEMVFDPSFFFDTVYHLNAQGRPVRTQKVLDSLEPYLRRRTGRSGPHRVRWVPNSGSDSTSSEAL